MEIELGKWWMTAGAVDGKHLIGDILPPVFSKSDTVFARVICAPRISRTMFSLIVDY